MAENSKESNADNISNAKDKPKRQYTVEPVIGVLKKAKTQFGRQVKKDNDTKRACIEANISKHYADELRFWLDFNAKVKALLDSVRFNEYCKKHNHDARQVAEHVVFEGKAFYNAVRDGIYDSLHEMAFMFNGNLFVDSENIYEKQKQLPQRAES